MSDTEIDPLRLDRMLCFAIYAAGHAFNRFYKPRLDALGLTYPQYLVLLVLWEQDGLSIKMLGERLILDSGTITPLVKRMETRGLMRRERDHEDERVVRVYLTEEGRALRQRALSIPLEVAGATDFDLDAIDQLRMALEQLREKLDAGPDDIAGPGER
ncbi:hypothetical protein GCM10007989_09580 [Devosia pacifica]|uniref:HTH marR-type domain-containing protein n=1 Tax=Devosia pacifica TaxID=1335967 RepID=A0A918VRC9_9HYPH|nr:MarR family transcriptional regulator [Devosia pacifica]GHA16606.1 hypothetical protein GCM10007989_09580 [Devosia pacifica]